MKHPNSAPVKWKVELTPVRVILVDRLFVLMVITSLFFMVLFPGVMDVPLTVILESME